MILDEIKEDYSVINRRGVLWLGLGIGSIALVIGYMVGASSVSVVSVAVPVIFGLIVTAMGFIGSSGSDKQISELKESIEKTLHIDEENAENTVSKQLEPFLLSLESFKKDSALNIERIGKILVVFTLFYAIGLSFGTYARITNLYFTKSTRKLPWKIKAHAEPPTAAIAVEWITLQENLLRLGYSEDQIDEIYSIGADTLGTKTEMTGSLPATPAPTPQSAMGTPYPSP